MGRKHEKARRVNRKAERRAKQRDEQLRQVAAARNGNRTPRRR